MNEIDKLFEGLPDDQPAKNPSEDIFDNPDTPEKGDNKSESKPHENDDEPRKNRRHRRLEQQLEQEREARIIAETRAEALSESRQFADDTKDISVDERFLRIYGDSPETRKAWQLQQEILNDYKSQAKEEALQEIEDRNTYTQQQTKRFESLIDDELEAIEDQYDVDVTSDSPSARKTRREFLEMVQQASPKDENGTITGFAVFDYVWESYQLKRSSEKNVSTRNKDLSSRSMEKSAGSQSNSVPKITPGFDGWRKDYGLN